MTARYLNCTCCGGSAGRWQQWHNQDTGYGLCARCAAWIAGRGQTEDMDRTYGVPGVHREAPTHVLNGRRFNVLATFRAAEAAKANAYMAAHPGASVLEVTDTDVILADVADEGVPA